MGNKIRCTLTEGHIYRYGDLLLEAAYCDTWTLNLLTSLGEYASLEHGALIAFNQRTDGLWESVHCSCSPLIPGGELLSFFYGVPLVIEPTQLIFVAAQLSDVPSYLCEQQQEQEFCELMATMEW